MHRILTMLTESINEGYISDKNTLLVYVVTDAKKVAYQSWEVKLIAINLSSSLASWWTDKHLNDSLVRVVLPSILCCTVRTEPSVLVMYVLTPERSRHLYWVTQAGKLHEATGQPNTSAMKWYCKTLYFGESKFLQIRHISPHICFPYFCKVEPSSCNSVYKFWKSDHNQGSYDHFKSPMPPQTPWCTPLQICAKIKCSQIFVVLQ